MDVFTYFFAFGGGILCIAAAIYDWDWFFDNFRARPFVALFGREGARWFYAILGVFLIMVAGRLTVFGH
ncbi:immunity 17 family protein [Wielerella bovis]|uniref:immunity 17 family protein n=1 Tax=Wielerella bovis TaxID=2917790 RepID=UPI0020191ECE|nr:immunity 17 family protein [Wielerella bovis]ULJ69463.1 immunity 17 family protein [Wielerella bovis]